MRGDRAVRERKRNIISGKDGGREGDNTYRPAESYRGRGCGHLTNWKPTHLLPTSQSDITTCQVPTADKTCLRWIRYNKVTCNSYLQLFEVLVFDCHI